MFNDAAVAARAMQAENRARRVLVVDCDVHQGNGTAAIFADDPTVFTFSIHAANNYPFEKVAGDLDIALPDATPGARYLEALADGLARALDAARPQLAIYLASADPFERDQLGKLALSAADLAERDRIVFEACRSSGVSVAAVMSGGYAQDVADIVAIHLATVRTAARYSGSPAPAPPPNNFRS